TGTGTSAVLHDGRLYIKRGGMNYGVSNGELWVVTPVPAGERQSTQARSARERMRLEKVDYLSIQMDSAGAEPFDVWIDGLGFE
ncbi:MAG: hypothetical protein ACPMAQ_05020, partial [Phycisphaerae bacterium]